MKKGVVILKWDVGSPPVEDEINYATSAGKPLRWFLKRTCHLAISEV